MKVGRSRKDLPRWYNLWLHLTLLVLVLTTCQQESLQETATSTLPTLAISEPAPPSPTPIPTSAPEEISRDGIEGMRVVTWTIQPSLEGEWEILGVLKNNGLSPYHELLINMDVLDDAGDVIETFHTLPFLHVLPVGGRSPFRFHLEDQDPPLAVKFWVQGTPLNTAPTISIQPSGFQIFRGEYRQAHLLGRIANNTQVPIMLKGIAGSLLEPNGELLAVAHAAAQPKYLDPGEDAPVRISFNLLETIAIGELGYELFFELEESIPRDDVSLKFEEPVDYLDPSGEFHLVGEVRNQSNIPLMLKLLAAIYDVTGSVVDVAEVHSVYVPPGGSAGYDFDRWGLLAGNPGPYLDAESFGLQWDPGGTEILSSTPSRLKIEHETQQSTSLGLKVIGVVELPEVEEGSRVILSVVIREEETGQVVAVEHQSLSEAQIVPGHYQVEFQLPLPIGFDPGFTVVTLQAILIPPDSP